MRIEASYDPWKSDDRVIYVKEDFSGSLSPERRFVCHLACLRRNLYWIKEIFVDACFPDARDQSKLGPEKYTTQKNARVK